MRSDEREELEDADLLGGRLLLVLALSHHILLRGIQKTLACLTSQILQLLVFYQHLYNILL